MKHKHNYEEIYSRQSTNEKNNFDISMCVDCGSVRVYYKDINKVVVVKKPEVK